MALSANIVKVFIIGKGFFTSHILLADVKDAGDFVAAIRREFDLTAAEARNLELRVVPTEPNVKNAAQLFDDAPEEAAIIDSASLPKPGAWVVGKISSGSFFFSMGVVNLARRKRSQLSTLVTFIPPPSSQVPPRCRAPPSQRLRRLHHKRRFNWNVMIPSSRCTPR